ncbi:granzyme B-like [Micractinium conductrix]|uniref:Granzyme B-like n=1 Tax=Micractinium conductrix TaxID=554055 RepID=A0A2P6V516_9CHLO|nr:granzyme B-like [Micractinium conductrix]|eukprot:PSC69186.1 granzyme B-like [Micractinium conductrix]
MHAAVLLLLLLAAGAQGRELLEGGVSGAVLNGHVAPLGRFDYIAQLRYPWKDNSTSVKQGDFRCQGVLIRPDIVLTSAWCVPESGVWPHVKIGAYKTDGPAKATRKVIATAWNTGYLKQATVLNIVNNVALMQLDKPVHRVPSVRVPKGFPSPAATVGEEMCILGYGATSGADGTPLVAPKLMKGTQRRMSQATCDKHWGNFVDPCYANCTTSNWDTKQYMCTANEKHEQALCWYAGGAPLVRFSHKGAAHDVVIGVGAYTECKGRGPKSGSVFANVAKYAAWIDRGVQLLRAGASKDVGAYGIARSKDYPPQKKCTPVGRRCETTPSTYSSAEDSCCVGSCILGACMPVVP